MRKRLFAKKSIDDLKEDASGKKGGLEKTLSGFNLVALGIGAIIGAGIFVLTGQAAAQYAGPGVSLSFLFAAIICAFTAFCFAELASLIPSAGGPYSYAYAAFGEFIAWTVGWGMTLEYLFSCATASVGFSGYFASLLADFGLSLPASIAQSPLAYDAMTGWASTGALVNLPAMIVVALIGIMVSIGVKTAAKFNNIMVVVKVLVIVLFVVCGIAYVNVANWTPFIPTNTGAFGQFGFSGIIRGAGVVFFAFIGFDALSTLAQEAKNPQRDMPIGMVGSLAICTVIYGVVGLVLTGVLRYTELGGAAPFSDAIRVFGPQFKWLAYVSKMGILLGLTPVVLVMLMGQSRIFYTMAHDGLLPKVFGKVHSKFNTPFICTLVLTAIAMVLCGFFPVVILGQLTAMGALLAFTVVNFAVVVLRYKQPHLHRPFKVPFFPWIPLAGALVCILQMIAQPKVIWVQTLLWLAIGYLIYFTYGIRRSVLQRQVARKK